jgi:hypothetical protein
MVVERLESRASATRVLESTKNSRASPQSREVSTSGTQSSTRPPDKNFQKREVSQILLPSPSMFGRLMLQFAPHISAVDVQPPSWLASFMYACALRVVSCYSGWKIHLRSYSIRHSSEPVFRAALSNNVRLLRTLFDSGLASPFDCCEEGFNLLYVSRVVPNI